MDFNYQKIQLNHVNTPLRVVRGHFATNHVHTNYYIDVTTAKSRVSEAQEIAAELCHYYKYDMVVDTIVCTEGTKVIGAFLAEELAKGGFRSKNAHKTIYVISPEFNSSGQMIFTDSYKPMVKGKNVIILTTAVRTGLTIARAAEAIKYFGGIIQGVSAIFSAVDEACGYPVMAVFTKEQLPDFEYCNSGDCKLCKAGRKLDAMITQYGFQII